MRNLEKKVFSLEAKINTLERLLQATRIVNSTLDLSTTLEMLMSLASELLKAEAASVLLMDEEKKQLYFAAATGTKKEEIKKIYLQAGEGIAGLVAQTGQPLYVPDVSKDSHFSAKSDHLIGFTTHSVLAVPLKIENQLIGVVEVVNKKENKEFSPEDLNLLETLATNGALAIQKAHLYQDLNELFLATVRAIADAVEAKDPYTRGHCERIYQLCLMIGEELNLQGKEKKDLELAALLHDVGKIGVPETILLKEGKPTEEEWILIKKHPVVGAEILAGIKQLSGAIPGIRYHQEKYNGQGYPEGLKGEKIPLVARIIAVADSYDAMTSDRPYRKGIPRKVALEELVRLRGEQFDPQCVDVFLRGLEK